jgi:neutral ceramidase
MNIEIGVGKYDITGPCAEIGFMGYWDFSQKGAGILSRLFSRAYVIEDLSNGKSIALVCADMGMCTQSVQQAVVKKLKNRFGGIYTEKNVLISGNHTHSGPGGFSHHLVYNGSMLGFNKQNFNCIVNGIFQSIVKAHLTKTKGAISIAKGDVEECGKNRSLNAYNNNDEVKANSSSPPPPEFKEMTLLKFTKSTGEALGSLNWFAVHATNFGQINKLITGDNKGYAEGLFEKEKGVVSAFANSCCGDISPNVGLGIPDGIHDLERAIDFGKKQYDKAVELFDHANEELSGSVDFRHAYIDMSNCAVGGTYTINGTDERTWPAALGLGMTSGSSEDSVGFNVWPEGTTRDNVEHDPELIREILGQMLPGLFGLACPAMEQEYIDGHAEKPILAPVGLIKILGAPVAPSILPLQLIKLGSLIIIAHPGEMTTMAGRRMRKTILDILGGDGIKHAVVATYAGAFSSYTTTREEYAMQHYEGASTLYGPWTLAAYQQENAKLAAAMKNNVDAGSGPEPPDLSKKQVSLQTGVWFDDKPWNREFGDVKKQPGLSYHRGEKVEVSFYGAHPNNDLRTEDTYLKVEAFVAGQWNAVNSDKDFCTHFGWKREGIASSIITIEWQIPPTQDLGVYRIGYYGNWKSGWTGEINEFSGVSREFSIT